MSEGLVGEGRSRSSDLQGKVNSWQTSFSLSPLETWGPKGKEKEIVCQENMSKGSNFQDYCLWRRYDGNWTTKGLLYLQGPSPPIVSFLFFLERETDGGRRDRLTAIRDGESGPTCISYFPSSLLPSLIPTENREKEEKKRRRKLMPKVGQTLSISLIKA